MQETEAILEILNRKALVIGTLVLKRLLEGLKEQGLGIQVELPGMNPTMIQNLLGSTTSGVVYYLRLEARDHHHLLSLLGTWRKKI